MTKEENNRKLAEWLGMPLTQPCHMDCGVDHPAEIPDFYLNEEANALLREKIPFLVIRRSNLPHGNGLERWSVGLQAQPKKGIPVWWAEAANVKDGVVEAALRLIEREKGKDSTADGL